MAYHGTVTASVTNLCGTYSRDKYITVTGGFDPICIPPALRGNTPPRDGDDDGYRTSATEEDQPCLCNIKIYPNPAMDVLSVEFVESKDANDPDYDIRLYDGQGNMLRQSTTKGGTVQFNVSYISNGIYFLYIYDGVNSKPEIHQIVVER